MTTENAAAATGTTETTVAPKAKKVKAPKEVKPKIQITPEQIKTDLINGLNRDEIAEKYGMPRTVVNRFFKHESLKGLRPKQKSQWELVVDGEVVPVNAIPNEKKVKPAEETIETETTEELQAQVAPAPSGSIADRVSEANGI